MNAPAIRRLRFVCQCIALGALAGVIPAALDVFLSESSWSSLKEVIFTGELFVLTGALAGVCCGLGILLWRIFKKQPVEFPDTFLAGFLLPGLVLSFIVASYGINHRFLPWFTDPKSIAFNAAFSLVFLFLLIWTPALSRKLDQRIPANRSRSLLSILPAAGGVILIAALIHFIPARIFVPGVESSSAGQVREVISSSGKETGKFPIFLILIDTLRADNLSCYGYERKTSPHMDQLASEGILFENAFSSSPWTIPSVATLFSGLYPSAHQVFYFDSVLSPEVLTLAECLRGVGYTTAGFFANQLIDHRHGFRQGFDITYPPADPDWFFHRNTSLEKLTELIVSDVDFQRGYRIIQKTTSWLKSQSREQVFCYMHFMEPHAPYIPPEPYKSRFLPEGLNPLGRTPERNEDGSWPALPEDQRQSLLSQYDGEIAYIDAMLGEFFGFLRDTGWYDKSMILLIADHGEEFYEHGGWSHHEKLYRQLTKVPMIIKWPGGNHAGLRIQTPAELVDLRVSLMNLLGYRLPEPNHGQSFFQWLEDEPEAGVMAFGEDPSGHRMARGREWAFIERPAATGVSEELYSSDDREEDENRADAQKNTVIEMREKVRAWEERVAADSYGSTRIDSDENRLQQMRNLGYIR